LIKGNFYNFLDIPRYQALLGSVYLSMAKQSLADKHYQVELGNEPKQIFPIIQFSIPIEIIN